MESLRADLSAAVRRADLNVVRHTPAVQYPAEQHVGFMLPAISSMLYMGVMMAAFVVTAVILIQRFYKNLLGSEGYLMFTLPVTVTQHLLSKTIIAVVMIALSGIAAFLSIGIFADMSFGTLFVDMIKGVARSGGLLFGLELLVLAVLGIADMALFRLYVHGARPSGGQAPPADVGRVVRCSFYRPAGSPASGDDGRGQCHAGGACRCDGTLA